MTAVTIPNNMNSSANRQKSLVCDKMPISTWTEDDDIPAPALITPTSSSLTVLQIVTNDSITQEEGSESSSSSLKDLNRELEEARWDARQSAEALEYLIDGIRAVKRILERSTTTTSDSHDDQQQQPNSTNDCNETSKDRSLLSEVSNKLYGFLGSDLLGLVNAADMVREHAKLSAEEACVLVQDVNETLEKAEESKLQAKQARKVSRTLYKENLSLSQEVGLLRRERRALVKEVKVLRQETEETRKFDAWRLLEDHVLDSIAMHEKILKTPTSPRPNAFAEETPTERRDGSSSTTTTTHNKENLSSKTKGGVVSPLITTEKIQGTQQTAAETPQSSQTTTECSAPKDPLPRSRGIGFGGLSGFRGAFGGGVGLGYGNRFRSRQQQSTENSATAKKDKKATNASGDDKSPKIATGISETSSEEPLSLEQPVETRKEVVCSLDGNNRSKSPMPSLVASSIVTDDSWSEAHTRETEESDPAEPSHGNLMVLPQNVAFQQQQQSEGVPDHLVSPMLSPDGSPSGVVAPDYKPICDPHVLRTLAIPSYEKMSIDYKRPSPRTRVGPGLYAC
jgi:hypothetical protein